ncbi:uncharacterized protein LOC108939050 [Arapaima gigas]
MSAGRRDLTTAVKMEQNNADLSSDTSLGLVCYQEGDLNFDNLNPDECDEERTESIDFSWLPVLKEAGDPEQMEGCVEVCNSASEKEWEWDIPQDIQNQCSGQIQYVGPLDDNVIHETGNKEDEDEKQELSNEERAEKVVQETINKDSDSAEDDEDVVQGTCNKERASSEEDENIGMDDFSFPSYLSQVDSLQGQHLEEKEEATYYEGRQILLKDEEDTIDDNNTMKEMLYHLLPPHSRMQMEGRTNKMESKKGKIVEEKEAKADGNSGNRQLANVLTLLEKDDFHGQSSGDLKEFSEDDQGVTGEDYAEYPSECFQQGDVEDRNKKTGHIKAEKTRKLDGSGHPGGETCEWELLERHRDFCKEQMLRKEGGRDILKESDEIVWGEITEEQASEEELLKGENMNMKEKGMARHTEGERSMLEEIMTSYSYSLNEPNNEELDHTESLKYMKEVGHNEGFTEVEDTHERFGDTLDEGDDKIQCKNDIQHYKETEYDQKNDGESNFKCADNDGGQEVEERNDSHPVLESLGVWTTSTSTRSLSGTDSDRSSEGHFSPSKPFEMSNHPMIWPNDGTDPTSPNISEKTAWLTAGDPAGTTKFSYLQEISWKAKMSPEGLTSAVHPTTLLDPEGAFNYDNTISQHIHEVGQLVDEITANLYSEHEAHSSVETQEHEFQDDDEEAQVRNWEEENKRIEAFNRYYNDDQGAGAADYAALKNPERKHTVRFCIQPNLPTERQVGDLPGHQSLTTTAQEMKEVPKTLKQRDKSEDSDGKRHKEDFALLLQQSQATQKELLKLNTELKAHCRKDKRPSVLHDCLKISLMTVVGVLFFWWATDQLEWMY